MNEFEVNFTTHIHCRDWFIRSKEDYFEFKAQLARIPDASQPGSHRLVEEEKLMKESITEKGSCSLLCKHCRSVIVKVNSLDSLPHNSWIESAANWFCSCSGTRFTF